MTIDALPTVPSTASPTTFADDMDTFLAALPTFRTQANALSVAMNAVAAGGAVSLQYTFSTTTADADPGAGTVRLDNATQNAATTIRADLAGSDGSDLSGVLALLDDSTSTNKGYITLRHKTTPTKWLVFSVASLASPSGYKNVTVTCVASSAASPLANGDEILLDFTPTGDKGETGATGAPGAAGAPGVDGATGAMILLSTVTASNSATVDVETTFDGTYDAYVLVISGMVPATDNTTLNCRMKLGGAYAAADYAYHVATLPSSVNSYSGTLNSVSADAIPLSSNHGNTAGDSADFVVHVTNPTSTALQKKIHFTGCVVRGSAIRTVMGAGCNSATTALTGLRFLMSSGNITSGTFRLYGIVNS